MRCSFEDGYFTATRRTSLRMLLLAGQERSKLAGSALTSRTRFTLSTSMRRSWHLRPSFSLRGSFHRRLTIYRICSNNAGRMGLVQHDRQLAIGNVLRLLESGNQDQAFQGAAEVLRRGMGCVVPLYRPRDAEHTVLHQVISEHLETFLSATAEAGGGGARSQPFLNRPCPASPWVRSLPPPGGGTRWPLPGPSRPGCPPTCAGSRPGDR